MILQLAGVTSTRSDPSAALADLQILMGELRMGEEHSAALNYRLTVASELLVTRPLRLIF